jgi:hypothetical protein
MCPLYSELFRKSPTLCHRKFVSQKLHKFVVVFKAHVARFFKLQGTETCWWLAISNKIHFNKVNSLVFCVLQFNVLVWNILKIKMEFAVVMFLLVLNLALSFVATLGHGILCSWLLSLEFDHRVGLQFVPSYWQSHCGMCSVFCVLIGYLFW